MSGGGVLLVAEQVREFPLQGLFNESLAEVFEEVFNLAGGLSLCEELFQELVIE